MTTQEQPTLDSTNSDYRYSCGIVSTSTYETGRKTPPIQCVEEFWPLKTPSQFMTSRKSECNFVTSAPANVNSSSLFVANNEPGPRAISMDSTSTYSSGSTPPKTPKHHLRFHINPFKFSKTRNKSAGTIPASTDALNSGYSGSHTPSATSSAFSLSSGDRSGSISKLSPQPRESTTGTYFDRANAQGKRFSKVSNTVLETNKMVVDYDPATGNKIINKYMIIREIGRGCHGKVKLCQDIETGTFFAIKIVEKSFRRRLGQKQSQSSSLDKIRKEIAILKKCRHPHVVRLYEVIDDPEAKKIYLVLEYVDGGEMTWRDEYDKPILSLDCSRQVLRDVVLGLEYLHHQGIIHRDIKPANLLWTKDGVVKISDFGVSYFSRNRNSLAFQPHLCMENGRSLNYLKDDRSSPSLQSTSGDDSGESFHAFTHTNNDADESNELELAKTAGSPAFFAPELCYSGEEFSDLSTDCQNSKTGSSYNRDSRGSQVTTSKPPVTKAIDVWALGITLYCLIYGRCPFMAETEYELFHLIPKKPLEFPEDVPIPSSLKDLLSRLLEKNPLQRITLEEIKHHPWVIQDLSNPEQWHRETNPSKYESLEATEEEVKRAVTLKDRLKKHIRKITTSIFHVGISIGLRRKSKTSLE